MSLSSLRTSLASGSTVVTNLQNDAKANFSAMAPNRQNIIDNAATFTGTDVTNYINQKSSTQTNYAQMAQALQDLETTLNSIKTALTT